LSVEQKNPCDLLTCNNLDNDSEIEASKCQDEDMLTYSI